MNILIILFYYDRPKMVQDISLKSIFASTSDCFEIRMIDDSNDQNADMIVNEFFTNNPEFYHHRSKVTIYKTDDTLESKIARGREAVEAGREDQQGGSIFGKFAQQAVNDSPADVCFMLCDDDAILPDYVENLIDFYTNHPEVNYSYCNIVIFDPRNGIPVADGNYSGCHLNGTECLQPAARVDSSQVSWRKVPYIEDGITFHWPRTRDHDKVVFSQMYEKWGDCCHNECYGQFKGEFPDRLMNRAGAFDHENFYKITNA